MALLGAFALGVFVVVALAARFFLPAYAPFVFVGFGVVLFVVGAVQYRCPFCGHFPEAEIPLYYPDACCHCGEKLR
jgi:predicted membrane channel-forming protein YqfA (hemolysin III family)